MLLVYGLLTCFAICTCQNFIAHTRHAKMEVVLDVQVELEAEIAEMHPAITLLLLTWRRYQPSTALLRHFPRLSTCLFAEFCLAPVQFLVEICEAMAICEGNSLGNV